MNWYEFSGGINDNKSKKAAVFNGVPPEAFKYTDKNCRRNIFNFINEFWNERADLHIWHKINALLY